MFDVCGDNRFEVIEKAKRDILDATNIGISPDEMKALDSFLFRCWQMGWLNKYEDAVKVDDMREFAEYVAYQFGYYCHNGGRLHITHGGLSTLERAFDILGWKNPHPVPECECEVDGCHEHATCGAPTNDGYKRMCGRHFREKRTDNA